MSRWFQTFPFRMAYRWRGSVAALLGLGGILGCGGGADWRLWSLVALLAGLALRGWARAHIGIHTRGRELAAPYRAVGGPYRFFPHPLYLANSLVAWGLVGVHADWWRGLLAALPVACFYALLAAGESAYLKTCADLPEASEIPHSAWSKELWSFLPVLLFWISRVLGRF